MGMGQAHDRRTPGRLLEGLWDSEAEAAGEILRACSRLAVAPGASHTRSSLPDAVLLIVEHGFVVLRSTRRRGSRAIVTCEAGAGMMLLPPAPDEVLEGLTDALVIMLGREVRDRLLELPGAARAIADGLATTLAQKQEALGNFASTRHIDRVRSKVLQLSRTYGRVVRDGIRIDFPLRPWPPCRDDRLVSRDGHTRSRRTATHGLRRPRGAHVPPARPTRGRPAYAALVGTRRCPIEAPRRV